MSSLTFFHVPSRQLRLEVRHDRGHVCLVRREDRRRREVVGEARHDEAHGAVRRQLPEIQLERVQAANPLNAACPKPST